MSQYYSFILQSWQTNQEPAMRWRVYCVRSEDEIRFPDASLVVRIWIEDGTEIVRGLVRHVQSGREVQFQSTRRAIDFVHAWLGDTASVSAEEATGTCQEGSVILSTGEHPGGGNGG